MGKKIKCLVWDLDNTVWDGTILEDDKVTLKPDMISIIKALDERGILQSVASKNNYDAAMDQLKEFGLDEYFIYPQINWNSKADSIAQIAKSINIGIDTLAFIDDQPTEREEVRYSHQDVLVLDAVDYTKLLDMDEFTPRFITEDSKKRRMMYQSDISRKQEEAAFSGPNEEFLATLGMHLKLSRVKEEDLQRVEELTVRTNQLNSTGYTYSYEELTEYIHSDDYLFLIAELKDRFGEYGKIGLVLIECDREKYVIKLLLMSCRVMTKGIGTAILVYLIKTAQQNNKALYAEFLSTDKNRVMYITYKLMGFVEEGDESEDGKVLFQYASDIQREYPGYLTIEIEE